MRATKDTHYKWFHLGLSFDLHYDKLKVIVSSHKDPERRMKDMLVQWLQDEHVDGSVASWRSLVISLSGPLVQEQRIAICIGQQHCKQGN